MTVATRKFRPPAWATVALVLACAAFCAAGFWQLDRAEQKRRLFSEFDTSGTADVRTAPIADDELATATFRPMRLTGRYDGRHQFLLDVMVHQGQVGYQVLTPLRRDGVAVLVNRGWISAGADRTVLPDIPIGGEEREVSGLIAPLPRAGMRLDEEPVPTTAPWPRRVTFPSAEDIRAQLDYDVAGYQLLLDPGAAGGFVRDWRPAVMSPENHLGYAVQWFGMAIGLVIIYIVVNLQRTEEGETHDGTT